MRIGIVALSGSPVHTGHWAIIEQAAAENDEVRIFASTSDRRRRGERPISGLAKVRMWREHLEPILPPNASVTYGGSPVRKAWELLGEAEEEGSTAGFTVYGGREDLAKNFAPDKLKRYLPRLSSEGMVRTTPTRRVFSGTAMRQLLQQGDKAAFIRHLPPVPAESAEAIWQLFAGPQQASERMLRSWIGLLI